MLLSLTIAFCGMLIIILLIRSWPDYKVQTTVWDVEGADWITEDSDKMFYEVEIKNDKEHVIIVNINATVLDKGYNVMFCDICDCSFVNMKNENMNWIKKQWQKFIDWIFKGFYK
jgi:hypothetical protein